MQHATKIIQNKSSLLIHSWSDIWQAREIFTMLVLRYFITRYKQMILGFYWTLLGPIVNLAVFSAVFGYILKVPSEGYPYVIFAYAGIMPWGLFTHGTMGVANSLTDNLSIISKVYFPRIILPFVALAKSLLDSCVSLALLLLLAIIMGYYPTLRILAMPLILLACLLCGLAAGLIFAGPLVRFRDLNQPLGFALQMGMYISPIIYPPTVLPPQYSFIMEYNPMYWVIEFSRWSLLGKDIIITPRCYLSFAATLILLLAGWIIFAITERNVIDVQ